MADLRIVVIGGTAAGPKAASRAKRLNEQAEVTVLQKAPELSMGSCGYPYYVAGEVDDRAKLLSTGAGVVRDQAFFAGAKGITAMVNTEATAIDREGHVVTWKNLVTGETGHLPYDKLILTTGAKAKLPPIPGRELAGVTTLASLANADKLRAIADAGKGKKAVIIGGGLIGMESCEALITAGLDVTVVEALPQVLGFLDPELARLVANHATSKGATILTGVGLTEILGTDGAVSGVRLADGRELPCDVCVMAIGFAPETTLAKAAGLTIGETGGILTDDHMQTSDPNIYAAGDCVEVKNRLTGGKMLAPYGDLANLEGRVAGENAVMGNVATFPGTTGTGICKVFDFTAGSTGLSEARAQKAGRKVVTAVVAGPERPGFMGSKALVSKIVVDPESGRILGFQCVGAGNVNRQVAEMAMAVMAGLTVDDVAMADLPYAPPFSLAIDNAIAVAHVVQNKMRGLYEGVSNVQIKEALDAGKEPYLLDVRSPKEYERTRLGVGETLIPLGQLRKRIGELPADKSTPIVTYCLVSLRGYEAARVLMGHGYTNVKVMEGGLTAWPFAREK